MFIAGPFPFQEIDPLQIDMMQTSRLVPYIRNARTHSADQVAQIAASIAEIGRASCRERVSVLV